MPKIYTRQVRSRGLRPDWDQVIVEVARTMDSQVKPLFLGYLNKIVAPWSHPVSFRSRKRITRQEIVLYIWPEGEYAWLWYLISVTGAKRHDIAVKEADWLKFIWGGYGSYQARTTRSGGYKGPGQPTGTWRKMLLVDHPGFKPRNFEKWIVRWGGKKANAMLEAAFRRGIRQAKAHGT